MSKFTTEVRYICESYMGYDESGTYSDIEYIIAESAPYIFGYFPIFDETYRLQLETKILRHYYTREISEETVGLWRLRVNDKMNIIMPYYNKLYESELLKFNPFYDVDLTKDYSKKDDGSEGRIESENETEEMNRNVGETGRAESGEKETNVGQNSNTYREKKENAGSRQNGGSGEEKETRNLSDSSVTGENENKNVNNVLTKGGSETDSKGSWDLYSDTPQGGVDGINGALGNNAYLSNARHIIDDVTKTFTNRADTTSGVEKTNKNSSEIEMHEGGIEKENQYSEQSVEQNSENKSGGSGENFSSVSDVSRSSSNNKNINEENKGNKNSQRVGHSVITNMSEYIEHVVGKQGGHSYSKMLLEFRETMLNIDLMIIKELEPLFFGLWE